MNRFGLRIKMSRAALTAAIILTGTVAYALQSITIGAPLANTQWQKNAPIPLSGQYTWGVNDTKPDGVVVILHAGGNSGIATNSGKGILDLPLATTPPQGWSCSLNAVPLAPPIGNGTTAAVTYTVEAYMLHKGMPVTVPNTDPVQVINTFKPYLIVGG